MANNNLSVSTPTAGGATKQPLQIAAQKTIASPPTPTNPVGGVQQKPQAQFSSPITPQAPTTRKVGAATVTGEGTAVTDSSLRHAKSTAAGDPLVGARDYYKAGAYGGNVDWDGENVLLDGNSIKPTYVQNGTAYIPQSAADAAIAKHNQDKGITGNQGVLKNTDAKDNGRVDAALEQLLGRQKFDWDPETDKAWQDHVKMQTQYADDAMRYILNQNNSSLSNASASVIGEALGNRNNYLRQLSEDEQQFRNDAYDRYVGETQRQRDNLSDARDVLSDFYNREYQANRDSITDTVADTKAEREEEQRWIDNARNDRTDSRLDQQNNAQLRQAEAQIEAQNINNRKGTIDLETYGDLNAAELRAAELSNNKTMQDMAQTAINNTLTNAYNRGYFVASDADWLPYLKDYRLNENGVYVDADGEILKPWWSEGQYTYDINGASALGSQNSANGVYALPKRQIPGFVPSGNP